MWQKGIRPSSKFPEHYFTRKTFDKLLQNTTESNAFKLRAVGKRKRYLYLEKNKKILT